MEPYFAGFKHVQQDYEVTLELASEETQKTSSAQNSKAGSYGVSIRVQGIHGHPYIVLNNTEGCLSENPPPSGKEQQVISQTVSRPTTDSNTAFKLEDENSEHTKFPGTQHVQPCLFKSLKVTNMDEKENGISNFKDGTLKSSSLLNFQRHPELLQPYDPEKNNLNMDTYQSSMCSKSKSFADEGKTEARPWISSSKVVSLQKTNPYLAESTKASAKKIHLNRSVEDQNKQTLDCPSSVISPNEAHVLDSLSSAGGSACVSPIAHLETRKPRPDVLPFRRQDSAGPVLDDSRRSSSSSATPTSANSLYKFLLDDQEYAIYADNVNRHENRRYIPFLPGTGRDIDTGSLPGVDQLIEKFDKKAGPQRRGRMGKRNKIHPDDRKRSRSVDSALPLGLEVNSDYLHEFSKSLGKSTEHLLRPSEVCLHKQLPRDQKLPSTEMKGLARSTGKLQMPDKDIQNSHFNSLQYHKQNRTESFMFRSSTLPGQSKSEEVKTVTSTLLLPNRFTVPPDTGAKKISVKTFSSIPSIQATPDLLKGQQDLAQQTNEETAKQILYNYLKEGSADNDDATKRKVNLVFEKIQTLKSRAAGNAQVSDSSAEVKALSEQKTELERKVEELQKKLDLEIRNQQNAKEERDATQATLKELQLQLDENICEKDAFKKRLEESEKELRQNLEELFQVKMEREQYQTEIRDLQDQLSEMHDELDNAKHTDEGEKEVLIEELMQMKQDLQEVLVAKDQQEEILRKRERELTALKGALKEEVSSHDMEMDKIKEQHDKELLDLQQSLEKVTESAAVLESERNAAEEMQNSIQNQVKELTEENEQLKRTVDELQSKIKELYNQINNMKGEEDTAKEKIKRYEEEKQQLEEALEHAGNEEKELVVLKKSLESQLEDMQENISCISQERQQLTEQLKDETYQKKQLKKIKNEMENERWQLNKTIEKLQEEMAVMVEVSRTSALEFQNQLDDYKEKNRRELAELQRQLKEKNLEVEKSRLTTMKMQDEVMAHKFNDIF